MLGECTHMQALHHGWSRVRLPRYADLQHRRPGRAPGRHDHARSPAYRALYAWLRGHLAPYAGRRATSASHFDAIHVCWRDVAGGQRQWRILGNTRCGFWDGRRYCSGKNVTRVQVEMTAGPARLKLRSYPDERDVEGSVVSERALTVDEAAQVHALLAPFAPLFEAGDAPAEDA